MSFSADNDIIILNFCYCNTETKNIIFALEISKDKKVSDLQEENWAIDCSNFLCQIYSENPMQTEDRTFSYFNETPDDEGIQFPNE